MAGAAPRHGEPELVLARDDDVPLRERVDLHVLVVRACSGAGFGHLRTVLDERADGVAHDLRAGDEHTRDVAGTQLTFLADASDTGGNYSVMDVLVRPGLEPPPTSTRTRTRPTTCSRAAGRSVAATPPATAAPARGCSCRGV